MNKTAVLLLGIVMIFAFQNCGQMASSTDSSVGKQGVDRTYDLKLVSVRPAPSAGPDQPTEVVLDGYYADGCPAQLDTAVESEGNVHHVRATVTKTEVPNQACTLALRVFEEKVSLGDLEPGTHTVQYESEDGPKSLTLVVN